MDKKITYAAQSAVDANPGATDPVTMLSRIIQLEQKAGIESPELPKEKPAEAKPAAGTPVETKPA